MQLTVDVGSLDQFSWLQIMKKSAHSGYRTKWFHWTEVSDGLPDFFLLVSVPFQIADKERP